MLSLSGALLMHLRLHPSANSTVKLTPNEFFVDISDTAQGGQKVQALRLFWSVQMPLLMLSNLHFLPMTLQYWLGRASLILAFVGILLALLSLKNWGKARGIYTERLLSMEGGDSTVLHWKSSFKRLAYDQQKMHSKLYKASLAEHRELHLALVALLVSVSLLGFTL
jgi:hypothetical protein